MKKLFFAILLLGPIFALQAQKLYSLDELLQKVDTLSTGTAIDRARIEGAEADRLRARTAYFPKLSATSGWVSIRRPLQLFDATATISELFGPVAPIVNRLVGDKLNNMGTLDFRNTWFVNVSAAQPLFAGGEIVASNKMADLALELRHTQRVRSSEERRYAVREAYYLLVGLYEQQTLLEQYQAMNDSVISDIEELYKEGYATKSDLLEVRLAQAKAKRGKQELDEMLPIASHNLSIVVGLPEDIEIRPKCVRETLVRDAEHLVTEAFSLEISPGPPSVESTDSRTKMLTLTSRIADCETAVERSHMFPKLALFANYSAFYPNFFNAMEKKIGGTFSFGVILQVPITDIYGSCQAKRSAAQRALITQLDAQEKGRKIALEQTKLLRESRSAASNYISNHGQCQDANANLQLAREGYKEGVVDIEKLLRVQADWLQINSDYIKSIVALHTKWAAYCLSTI